MKIKSLFLASLLFGATGILHAQQSIFQGRVTDQEGHALPGARIKISVGFTFVAEVQADDKGLYYTQLLPAGGYNIAVAADGKHEHTKRRVLLEKTGSYDRRFYNLALTGKKLRVQVTDADPFMAAKLEAPDPAKRDVYMGEMHAIMKIDKDGKMIGDTGVPRGPEAFRL